MFVRNYYAGRFFAPRYFLSVAGSAFIVTQPIGSLSLAMAYYPVLYVGLAMSNEIPLTLSYQPTEQLSLTNESTIAVRLSYENTIDLFMDAENTISLILEG